MALTVGTDTYISVADAKLMAPALGEEGLEFSELTDAEVETLLTYALTEIEELPLTGSEKSTGQALRFPRAFSAPRDTNGTTFAAKAQVYNAIARMIGKQRQLDRRVIKESNSGFSQPSTMQLLASFEAVELLDGAGYLETPGASEGSNFSVTGNQGQRRLPT